MKNLFLLSLSLVFVSCSTGIGKKMSQETIDSIQAGKGKMTRDDVRKKIGAAPQTQMEREGMQCDSYAYSGFTNYFLFTTADKSQSYNFCYDTKTQVLTRVDGLQM
jgi:hypothetical protein